MSKIYKCFISSTYRDLEEERRRVIEAVLDCRHLPVGMENFSAADESQWDYITRMLEDCDYFIVIVAHRYGSTDESGMSYTEKETRYALGKGIPVLAFILDSSVKDWPHDRYETSPANKERLKGFKEFLEKHRLVKYWTNKGELAAKVVVALHEAIDTHPRPGYIRGNQETNHAACHDLAREPKFDIAFGGKPEITIDLAQAKNIEEVPILPRVAELSYGQPEKLHVSDSDVEKWNMAVPDYNAEIDEYNGKAEEYNRQIGALPVEFSVSNTGTRRANHLLLVMEFPDWIAVCDKDRLPRKPRMPKIPANPVAAALDRLKRRSDPFSALGALGSLSTLGAIPESEDIFGSRGFTLLLEKPVAHLKIKSRNVAEYHTDTIQHGSSLACEALGLLPAEKAAKAGVVRITCHCDELPTPQTFEVPIRIDWSS